ncbi:hypothetical protein [Nocardioides daphniae]|uniref:Glycosyltransferase RgtA/B/C/D-like domain-containing protein n=1 Tax=Nocardioides daphniae TaxID=402297 RepID=A0A4P7UDR0_9ACTN|nr:hypothetical protein [Nocardioides daphniae]QCC77059.1 hypothetical protein E2C04_07235 [Nocardioides daphniae]GGD19151.1 hypothetical protein GCM10007231_17860 [Nocardioides daphniae]
MTDTDTEVRPARSQPRRRLEPEASFSWLAMARDAFRSPAGAVAVLVIMVQAIWRGTSVAAGFFTQDDYLMLRRAADDPLDLAHLAAPHAGEFSPIGNLVFWATTRVAGIDWGAVTLVVVVLQAVAAVLMWVVLTQVLANRWVKLPLLAVALFTPLTLGTTMWWSLSSTHLPTVVLLLLGVSALLANLRQGWQAGTPVATVCLLLVLLCSDRSLALPFLAFVVVAAMLPDEEAGVGARLWGAATRYSTTWILLVVALVARVIVGVGRENSGYGWHHSFSDVKYVLEQYVRQGIAGLVGGPWGGTMSSTVLEPEENWPLAVAAVVCLLLLVPIVRSFRHPVVAVAGVGLVLNFLLGAVVLLLTKEGLTAMGMVSRFVADVVPAVVVIVALALRKTQVPAELRRLVVRWPSLVALGLAIAVTVSAGVTTRAMMPQLKNSDDRSYVDYITSGLELDPRIVLLDGPVPEGIMSALFGKDATVSTVVGLLPQQPTFDMPSEVLRVVDGAGILREVNVGMAVAAKEAPPGDCGWAVTGPSSRIPMSEELPAGDHVMEIAYLSGGDTYAEVVTGDTRVRLPIRAGVHEIALPVKSSFSEVTFLLEDPDQTVCVATLLAGAPVPAPLPEMP